MNESPQYHQITVTEAIAAVGKILNELCPPHEYRPAMTLLAVADTVGVSPNGVMMPVMTHLRCMPRFFSVEKMLIARAAMLTLRMYRDDGVFNIDWQPSPTRRQILTLLLYPDTAHPDLQAEHLWDLMRDDNQEQSAKGIPF